MTDPWTKIKNRLLAYGLLIPNGLNMVDAINILIDKLDEQQATIIEMQWALEKLAGEEDESANEYLKKNGSYSAFDEPHAVKISREALKKHKGEA